MKKKQHHRIQLSLTKQQAEKVIEVLARHTHTSGVSRRDTRLLQMATNSIYEALTGEAIQ